MPRPLATRPKRKAISAKTQLAWSAAILGHWIPAFRAGMATLQLTRARLDGKDCRNPEAKDGADSLSG
jgi:hypothetical protein